MQLLSCLLAAPLFLASGEEPYVFDFEGYAITQEEIDTIVAEALPVVEQATGVSFGEEGVSARIATSAEVADVLVQENVPIMRAQVGDTAEAQARAFASSISPMLLAKFAFHTEEILVVPETFARLARVLERPGIMSRGALRGVLVHELVHAADQRRHDLHEILVVLGETDSIRAFNAVMEGHAQHVARAASTELGWLEGFQRYTDCIGAEPPGFEELDHAQQLATRFATASVETAYTEGERFMAALAQHGGREAIERAFREPPADMQVIHHPRWFLFPEERPAVTTDLDAGLDRFAAAYSEGEWSAQRLSIDSAQVGAAFSILPAEVVARIQAALRQNRIVVLQRKSDPTSGSVTAMLYEWSNGAEGEFFQTAMRELHRTKDEQMSEGAVHIAEARYTKLSEGDLEGIVAEKDISVHGTMLATTSVIATSGTLSIELLYQGDAPVPESLEGDVRETIAAARRIAQASVESGAQAD